MKFNSQYSVGYDLPEFDQTQVKNEPMLFNCDGNFAIKNGGLITRTFLYTFALETGINIQNIIIDSRTHMLMKNWYPCIPGFHHDDIPRKKDGQPNYINPEYNSNHCLALINGDICPTEFAVGEAEFNPVPTGEIVYKQWHKEVVEHIRAGNLKSEFAPTNKLVYFNCNTWHQGTKCIKAGWRWFGRISWNTNRKPTNEIRSQVQVYMENPMEGW